MRRQGPQRWVCEGFAKGLRRVWRGKGAAPELLDMLDWAVRQATRQAAKGVHCRPGRAFATLGARHGSCSRDEVGCKLAAARILTRTHAGPLSSITSEGRGVESAGRFDWTWQVPLSHLMPEGVAAGVSQVERARRFLPRAPRYDYQMAETWRRVQALGRARP
jgi:hypothetical protein